MDRVRNLLNSFPFCTVVSKEAEAKLNNFSAIKAGPEWESFLTYISSTFRRNIMRWRYRQRISALSVSVSNYETEFAHLSNFSRYGSNTGRFHEYILLTSTIVSNMWESCLRQDVDSSDNDSSYDSDKDEGYNSQ